MPHRVIGIDLGSYAVKLAEIEVGFRALRPIDLRQARVAPGRPWPEAAIEALAPLRGARSPHHEAVYVGVPGDRVLVHHFDLPFSDPKKLDPVVGFELESQIPWDLDDVVYDWAPAGSGGRSGGARIAAAAARVAEVRGLVERLGAIGLDPRGVLPAPFAYAAATNGSSEPCAWIDIGHERTNVCVVADGAPRFVRAISRGGRAVTDALGEALGLDAERAEALKHSGPLDERALRAVRGAVEPLLRDLRLSLEACRERFDCAPERGVLCGGGARLRGLDAEVSRALGIRTSVSGGGTARPFDAPPEMALSVGCALRGVAKARLPDFRRGELAYRGDVSFLRSKVKHIAACVVAVLGAALLSGFASLASLKADRARLETRLRAETRTLFGSEVLDGKEVSRRLRGEPGEGEAPIPEASAFDVLSDLSSRTPPGPPEGALLLDVLELDIKPKKTYVKATTSSAASVDDLVSAWKQSKCVTEIQKGRVSDIAGGGQKQFTLTVSTECF